MTGRDAEPRPAASAGPAGPARTPTELDSVRAELAEMRETFAAIRRGDVDAVVVGPPSGQRLYTLVSTDRPYRIIVDEMGEGAATVSADGVVLYANLRLAALLGRAPGELIGSRVSAVLVPADRARLDAMMTASPGRTERAELELSGPDGSAVPASVSCTTLLIDGDLIHCLVFADLTRARAMRAELEHVSEQLRERAQELERTNAALTSSNEALTDFAQIISRDLSEPLSTIGGFAELLRERRPDLAGRDAEYLDLIESGVKRMHEIISGVLDAGKTGAPDLALEPVDVASVVRSTLRDLNRTIEDTGAVVDVAALPTVQADWTRLAQVFAHLVRNALTFVAPGVAPRVRIWADRLGDTWRITVADNGLGVAEADRERVFGMLQRAHPGYPGVGLGLAIVERNVIALGGSVRIAADAAGGSRVEVFLRAV